MKFATLLTSAACVASSVSAASSLSRADGLRDSVSHKRGDGDSYNDEEYEMTVDYDNKKVKIREETPSIEIKYEVKASSPLSVELHFEEAVGGPKKKKRHTKSNTLFHYVQEWKDANSDGIMQWSERVGTGRKIGSVAGGYGAIYPVPTSRTPDTYNFTIAEWNPSPVSLTGRAVATQNDITDPNALKLELELSDWQYQDEQNQLAVLIEVRMNSKMAVFENPDSGAVSQTSGSPYTSFEWSNKFAYGVDGEGSVQPRHATAAELKALRINTKKGRGEEAVYGWFSFGNNEAKGEFIRVYFSKALRLQYCNLFCSDHQVLTTFSGRPPSV
jgi:hypothetical protein